MILGFIVWTITVYFLIESLKDVLPEEFLDKFKEKIEYVVCVIFGAIMYIKEILSTSKTEKAILKKQTEMALHDFKENMENLKLVIIMLAVMVYEMVEKKFLERKTSVYKLNISENIAVTEFYEYNNEYNMYYNIA